jgi:lysophospholipase L1-like esterase
MKTWLVIAMLGFSVLAQAQADSLYRWNPAQSAVNALEGSAWPGDTAHFYRRLPAAAEAVVRKDVWDLSGNTAGLWLRFNSNSPTIIVRYKSTGARQLYHMPSTAVSGLDLYSHTIDGNWVWSMGKISFGDTTEYKFAGLDSVDQHVPNREYYLYLPLYNTVSWMELAVPAGHTLRPLPARSELPIIVYGTSIAQGGCASRPGLSWTNQLARKMDRPLVNLGFSGNGRLEKEVIDLIVTRPAATYILDCLPNCTGMDSMEVRRRLLYAVSTLRAAHPTTPIIITEHDGFTDEALHPGSRAPYQIVNRVARRLYDSLQSVKFPALLLLSKDAIHQSIETMVDGVHPNDAGMTQYANAYEQLLREVLHEASSMYTTTKPTSQRRDANIYDWETRHRAILTRCRQQPPSLVLIGNSITHFWGGEPVGGRVNGGSAWQKYFGEQAVQNMGFGWDRIENVLWRIYHGELDSIAPKNIVLMIGTNNLGMNSDQEITGGLAFLIDAIRRKQPAARILMMGIFPRRGMEERVARINQSIASMAKDLRIAYADAGKLFLKPDKKIDEALFTDGLHPNETGYDRLGAFIRQHLQ